MMSGSFLYNLWAALCSFSVYFVWALQQPMPLPLPIIASSFLAAIIGFFVLYPIRYILGYVLYTPSNVEHETIEVDENASANDAQANQQLIRPDKNSTVEFQDENSEEIAQVVRTMLHGQDQAVSN